MSNMKYDKYIVQGLTFEMKKCPVSENLRI